MTDAATQHRATKPKRQPKPDKISKVADDVVTPNSLATHLGCTRQNIARLTAEAVIEQRADGHYDQSASRLRYIKHLRSPRSSRSEADAAHVQAKAEMLQIKIAQQRRLLVRRDDVDALIDTICGVVLTHLSGLPARCAPRGDLAMRRGIERVVFEVRTEMAQACARMADERGEPPADAEA